MVDAHTQGRGWLNGLLSIVLIVGLGCGGGAGSESSAGKPTEDAAGAAPETNEEWRVLFDGTSLSGWRGFGLESVPECWQIEDGVIAWTSAETCGDLMTTEQFANFELALEWKVSPGGNSGIFFHVTEDHDRSWQTGPEMQVLDDELHPDGQKPETSAGSNYALHAPSAVVVRPVGEWNEVRLLVDGPHVEHWLNGTKIVDYELWSDDWEARVAASKFAAMPDYGRPTSGHIVLQHHGDEVWFRDIRVRELP